MQKSCMVDLNKAIELDPTDGENYWYRSNLNGYKKDYPAAIKDCNLYLIGISQIHQQQPHFFG